MPNPEMVGFKTDKANRDLNELMGLPGATRRAVRQAWFQMGRDLIRSAKNDINKGPKTGIVYLNVRLKSGRVKRRHKSSAAGESHANLNRDLIKSLSWMVHGEESMSFGYGFASATAKAARAAPVYAATIEYGSAPGVRPVIGARPSLKNALRRENLKFIQHLDQAWLREVVELGFKKGRT